MSFNIIPLKSISEFVSRILNNTINTSIVIENIIGNILLFLPMGFFLPCLTSKIRNLPKAILVGFVIILSVELIQLFSLLGSFDIDDIILNLLGLIAGYLIFRFKPVNYLLKKMYII